MTELHSPYEQNALADALAEAALAPPASDAEQQAFAAFADQVFFQLFIQTDDDIFDQFYNKLVSKRHMEDLNNGNGKQLTFAGFKRLLENVRKAISARRIVSSKVLLSPNLPGDTNPRHSTAGHTALIEGFDEAGNKVILTIIAIGTVVLQDDGSSQLVVEKAIVTRNSLT